MNVVLVFHTSNAERFSLVEPSYVFSCYRNVSIRTRFALLVRQKYYSDLSLFHGHLRLANESDEY